MGYTRFSAKNFRAAPSPREALVGAAGSAGGKAKWSWRQVSLTSDFPQQNVDRQTVAGLCARDAVRMTLRVDEDQSSPRVIRMMSSVDNPQIGRRWLISASRLR